MKVLIEIQKKVAANSDDPDHHTAALLIQDEMVILSACNELPYKLNKYKKLYPDRIQSPLKYIYISHSEAKLISKAAMYGIKTDGLTVFMRWFPCYECAKILINSGISELICDMYDKENKEHQDRYYFNEAYNMLLDSGVKLTFIK